MLYTRKGDTGTTCIFGCNQKFSKSSAITEALGALDEANSFLGLCRISVQDSEMLFISVKGKRRSLENILHNTQRTLFIIQAELAGAPKKIDKTKIDTIEQLIGSVEKILPPIHGFSVAGGTQQSAQLDVARTIARRAERRVVAVHDEGVQTIGKNTLAYLNRLSSLLFALARYTNHVAKIKEENPDYK